MYSEPLIIDCSVHEISNENIGKLNEYLQKNKLSNLEITYEKQGTDHQPTFICQTKLEDRIYKASASTKKDAEKKLRSYLWNFYFSKDSLSKPKPIPSSMPEKGLTQNDSSEIHSNNVRMVDYENFKNFLRGCIKNPENQKPVLFIDLSTIDQGSLKNIEVEQFCFNNFTKTVIFASDTLLEWKNSIVLLIKETNQTMIQEYINRVIYFLLDQNEESKIMILAMRQFPALISSAMKTGQTVLVFPDFHNLKSKF